MFPLAEKKKRILTIMEALSLSCEEEKGQHFWSNCTEIFTRFNIVEDMLKHFSPHYPKLSLTLATCVSEAFVFTLVGSAVSVDRCNDLHGITGSTVFTAGSIFAGVLGYLLIFSFKMLFLGRYTSIDKMNLQKELPVTPTKKLDVMLKKENKEWLRKKLPIWRFDRGHLQQQNIHFFSARILV